MKRLFLILTILATSISLWAQLRYDACIDNIYYKINAKEKTAEVTNVWGGKYDKNAPFPSSGYTLYSGEVVIPETIEFKGTTLKVTSIGEYAFDSSGLSSIYLPNTILSIKANAFSGCGLTSISIPKSVVSIEESAFSSCRLTEISIPNRVEKIGNYAFYHCAILKVTIEDGENNIEFCLNDERNFYGNICLAFDHCPIETLYLGRNISYDKPQTNCSPFSKSSLKEVTIGNSVTCINAQAFLDCKELVSIDIANSVTEIETQAFSGCSGLISINIPESVTSIGHGAFH